jgi:hypothetical protein
VAIKPGEVGIILEVAVVLVRDIKDTLDSNQAGAVGLEEEGTTLKVGTAVGEAFATGSSYSQALEAVPGGVGINPGVEAAVLG